MLKPKVKIKLTFDLFLLQTKLPVGKMYTFIYDVKLEFGLWKYFFLSAINNPLISEQKILKTSIKLTLKR